MSNTIDAVGFIFARGGSKGLPGKNTRLFAGKPLIAWAIEQARSVSRLRRIIVSTDSRDIADIALKFGAEVPFLRPPELAKDDSPEWHAWRHGLEFLQQTEGHLPDALVSIPTTAPLREPADIERCLDCYSVGDADVVITVTNANRNPYFNMVKADEQNFVSTVMPTNAITRRQDAPTVYDITTVAYVVNPKFVLSENSIFSGRVKAVIVPTERSVDIDTLLDFEIAEFLKHKTRQL
jgi:CMP-N-acetylneuraminic acid synthetase